MTIEEITKLRELDENDDLRKPKGCKKTRNLKALRELNNAIEYLLLNDRESFHCLVK